MFGAIGRWFRSLGDLLTGRIDSSRRGMDTDAGAIRTKYERIIKKRTQQIDQYKQALGALVAQKEQKIERLKQLTGEVERLENLKAGALAKARQRVQQLTQQGAAEDDVKRDDDYMKCLGAYNDFTSSLQEKQTYIAELETDVEQYTKSITEHKLQLKDHMQEIEQIRSESSEAVADIISAKQEKEVNDLLSGIAVDKSSEELQRLRRLRNEIKAEAKLSKELAGTDTKLQEDEFLRYAMESQSNTEFERLVGLAEQADAAPQEQAEPQQDAPDAKLPE
ncbi:hypothetical protein JXA32_10855 [Candidatus Sumerlaeota bacterium]|nr:hypothetical protein [Candidatus Sumerlaeota bacterium]